jgi:transposase
MLSYVIGIDIGSATCSVTILHPDKRPLGKATSFANDAVGFATLGAKLTQLGVPADQILIGMEATGLYWENLYYWLQPQGYQIQLLHPGQTHHFAEQRGLRAKTDRVDALTIARMLLSDEVRPAYVPEEQTANYRELVRMMSSLTAEAARYNIQIQGLLTVLFPEFTQVFADPSRPTARALLYCYPSAQAFLEAGVAAVTASLHAIAPQRYGQRTAQRLLTLAAQTVASGVARCARERSLRILCDQLRQTQEHLRSLEAEIAGLLKTDRGAAGLQSVPEFGPKTVAVLRAELGDVARFARSDQAVAYVGLDIRVRESGKWRGQRKVSKRGSGPVRRALYLAAVHSLTVPDSAFAAYYRHLIGRGVSKMSALMAVMRKMLTVAYRLLKSGGRYDATKVWAAPQPQPAATLKEAPAAA